MGELARTETNTSTLAEADAWETDALEAIETVDTPEAAEALLGRVKLAAEAVRISRLGAEREQRWGRVRLLAERRYGELLGPAERGAPKGNQNAISDNVTSGHVESQDDRKQRERARLVASVPEPVFTEYVESVPAPTRAGLLREAETRLKTSDVGQQAEASVEVRRQRAMRDFHDAVHKAAVLLPQLDNIIEGVLQVDAQYARDAAQRTLETWRRITERLDDGAALRRVK